MMNLFGFGQSADIHIKLSDEDTRKKATLKTEDGVVEEAYLYFDGETVSGEITIVLKKANQKLEHQGIRVDFIGQIEVYYDRGNTYDFVSMSKEVARPGELYENTTYGFIFNNVSKTFESYVGCNVKLRYFIRATVFRRLTDITKELDIVVHALSTFPDTDGNLKMEVGIEDCLHIEFEYNRSRYHLKDVIIGKIYFLLVRIKIKYMEIAIIKRESVGSGPGTYNENETIAKYEIMDGAPVKGETIPIRLFLSGYDLGPTMREVGKRFSVRYFLNLVLIDEEDRRYFKQQEITLFRKADLPARRAFPEANAVSNSSSPVTEEETVPANDEADSNTQLSE
uniref:Vacuolar protein sorting-associated protein 26 n=1 Tax=Panagrellus redivivus TaxID=6233 RepID=A0A7E4ZT28_PANRE